MNTRILGISIILGITLFIIIGCLFIIIRNFKKANLNQSKNFRKDIKTAFANSFVTSSIFSIITACIIYGFLEKILKGFHLPNGIINYCMYAAKIWFISSPFIGLELVVLGYFISIDYWKKSFFILGTKLIVFLVISFLYYQTRKFNCFLYAKPICDVIFLVYYSKICFDVTLNKA